MSARKTLYFTFGNHMHWVDMQWLWGYHVLPGSTRDMLRLMAETGTKGCANFDGIGYEKMAAECPDALAELREAVQAGRAEIVGASYGQPYGLFQGGESNIRQRVYGLRTVMRTLGVRPRAFWEEEFDFFPQLPQVLKGCGYTGACLFFQWTWHTPEIPKEPHSLILWEGLDGTRIPTIPRNDLNLHQWPEDFDQILESPLIRELEKPALVQWVELMPSKDWMCRSEVLLPRLKELLSDPRFDIRPMTLSGLIDAIGSEGAPVRRYTLDDVWHGVSLGKNADKHPRQSADLEQRLLRAEALAAMASLLGRPYPRWDVYPAWELEEAWRQLLAFQHHDNHECEGLCGDLGFKLCTTRDLADAVFNRVKQMLRPRLGIQDGGGPVSERGSMIRGMIAFNSLGWPRDVLCGAPSDMRRVADVPAFGFRLVAWDDAERSQWGPATVVGQNGRLENDHVRAAFDCRSGDLVALEAASGAWACASPERPIGSLEMHRGGRRITFAVESPSDVERAGAGSNGDADSPWWPGAFRLRGTDGSYIDIESRLDPVHPALQLQVLFWGLSRPDPGMNAGLRLHFPAPVADFEIVHDHPYAVGRIRAAADRRRKYPTGDWMTSPQWFETVQRPFTSESFVDLVDPATGHGLLIVHDGSQSWFRTEAGVAVLLTMYDAWDEDHASVGGGSGLWLLPHGPLRHVERVRIAAELLVDCFSFTPGLFDRSRPPELPPFFGSLHVDARSVLATAFYRETEEAGYGLESYAGKGMGYPFIVRLVEFDGNADDVRVRFPGRIAKVYRTNLMGEIETELQPEACEPPPGLAVVPWSAVRLAMRPHEIATLYLDLEMGRKVPRDLDSYRRVWATIHKEVAK